MKASIRFGMAALLGIASASADFSHWTDSSRVLINTTASGADIAADVADLRFADSTGAPLAFELERFDATAKLAEAWVLLPVVKGNSASQWFRLYWGNAGATSAASGPSVFSAAGGYAGVWHLGEDAAAGGGAFKDASGTGNDGTGVALNSAAKVEGAIGNGTLFMLAGSQGVSVPHNAGLHSASALTVEAWIRSTSQGPYRRYVNKPFTSAAPPWNEYGLEVDVTGSKPIFSVTVGDTEGGVSAGTVMLNQTWYHIVGTFDGVTQKIYVNGVMEAMLARSGPVSDYGQPLSIGKYAPDDYSRFDGTVDEVRVSRIARAADWIKLEYANQKAGQKLIGFRRFAGCQAVFQTPGDTTINEGALLRLSAKTGCAVDYAWSVISGPAPPILEPETPTLSLRVPRVSSDTFIVYRFTTTVDGRTRSADVKVVVKDAIPDPEFALPSASWNGSDTLKLNPEISNSAAMSAAMSPALQYAWTAAGLDVETVFGPDYPALCHPASGGDITIGLCLDNGGTPVCKQATVVVSAPTPLIPPRTTIDKAFAHGSGRRWDARGRAFPRPACGAVIPRRR